MTDPKLKGELLSAGAKTYVEGLAKQAVYGYTHRVQTKEMLKGTIVEPVSIALLSEVDFTEYTKNEARLENDWVGGTADIVTDRIIDVKSSWSLSTFPALPVDGYDKDYEWQLRAYMMLWNRNRAELCYCIVDTPDELIGYEDESIHLVSHIDPSMRVTRLPFERTGETEAKIIQKVGYAQQYFDRVVSEIKAAHV